jgi:transcriptional regulator with XRE-family HTH domain
VAAVGQWSGREAKALRQALRMSVRGFAEHLGVAARTVSKWEAQGARTRPFPETQALLDTALSRADSMAQARFELLLAPSVDGGGDSSGGVVPRGWEYETWAEDLERANVGLSRQDFNLVDRLLNRWLHRFHPDHLDAKGMYLVGRSLALLADSKRDQGALVGVGAAEQTYRRAHDVFGQLDVPRRTAQTELSLAVVMEMSGSLRAAARRYESLAADTRLCERDRVRAQLWVGTSLSKDGNYEYATQVMTEAAHRFELIGEFEDWSVAQQKIALAHRGSGKIDQALRGIELARTDGARHSPMQQVRLNTAHAHVLTSDKLTRDAGLTMLEQAAKMALRHQLAHQLRSIENIRQSAEQAASA